MLTTCSYPTLKMFLTYFNAILKGLQQYVTTTMLFFRVLNHAWNVRVNAIEVIMIIRDRWKNISTSQEA